VCQGRGAMQAAVAQGGGGPGGSGVLCARSPGRSCCATGRRVPRSRVLQWQRGTRGPRSLFFQRQRDPACALGAGGLPDGPYVPQRKTIVEMNNKTGEVWLKNPEADANEQVCGVRAPFASCIPRAGGSFCAGAGRRGRDLVFTET